MSETPSTWTENEKIFAWWIVYLKWKLYENINVMPSWAWVA